MIIAWKNYVDTYGSTARSKRTGRTMSNASRLVEQQKTRMKTSKTPATQNGTNKPTTKVEQSPSKTRGNDEASNLGVYMTMDELAELVKAVKENAKSKIETKHHSSTNQFFTFQVSRRRQQRFQVCSQDKYSDGKI